MSRRKRTPEWEFLRYVTLGQYLPTDSFIHRMHPAFKLLVFGLLVAAVTFSQTITVNLILLVTMVVLVRLARVPVRHALEGVRLALPALLVMAVFQVLLPPKMVTMAGSDGACLPLWAWQRFVVTDCSLRLVVVSMARLIELIVLTTLLTSSTTTTELAYGTEALLSPCRRLGLPAHQLAMVVTIALRFVPTLALQMERIVKAQTARGADFGLDGRWRFIRMIRRLLPLLVPLFLVSLRRSETLVVAMAARGYTGNARRSHRIRQRVRPADYLALGIAGAFCVLMFVLDFKA